MYQCSELKETITYTDLDGSHLVQLRVGLQDMVPPSALRGPEPSTHVVGSGEGPWANAEGLVMATSVENLHYDNSNFNWTSK